MVVFFAVINILIYNTPMMRLFMVVFFVMINIAKPFLLLQLTYAT